MNGFKAGNLEKSLGWLVNFTRACEQLGVDMYALTHHEYIEVRAREIMLKHLSLQAFRSPQFSGI